MNRKLLTIAIAFLIFAVVAAPVAAVLPAKSPLPQGFPFNKIWDLLKDLQNQITNIQLTPGPQGIQGPQGPVGAQGPQGPPGGAILITCNTTTGENIASIEGKTICLMNCPSGSRALDASLDNGLIDPTLRGQTQLGLFVPNDGLAHSGKLLCL